MVGNIQPYYDPGAAWKPLPTTPSDKPGWTGTAGGAAQMPAGVPAGTSVGDTSTPNTSTPNTPPLPPDPATIPPEKDQPSPTAPDGSGTPQGQTSIAPNALPPQQTQPPPNGPAPVDPFAFGNTPWGKDYIERTQKELADAHAASDEYRKQLLDAYKRGDYDNERYRAAMDRALANEEQMTRLQNQLAMNPPHRSTNDYAVANAGLTTALGAIGGSMAHLPATSALYAMGAAYNAASDRNDELFKQSMETWKEQANMASEGAKLDSGLQADALKASAGNAQMLDDKLRPLAAITGNVAMLQKLDAGAYDEVAKQIKDYQDISASYLPNQLAHQAQVNAWYGLQKNRADWSAQNGGKPVPPDVDQGFIQQATESIQTAMEGLGGKGDTAAGQTAREERQRAQTYIDDPTFQPLPANATPQQIAKRKSDAQLQARQDFQKQTAGETKQADIDQRAKTYREDPTFKPLPPNATAQQIDRRNSDAQLQAQKDFDLKTSAAEKGTTPKAYTLVGPDGKSQGVNLSWLPQERRYWDTDKNDYFEKPPGYQLQPAPAGGGRIATAQVNSMVAAGNDAVKALSNLVELPVTATTGWFMGTETHPPGDLGAWKAVLAHKMMPEETRALQTTFQGVQRAMATLEAQGRATGLVGLTTVAGGLAPQQGDTAIDIMRKYAEIRQIVETNLDAVAHQGNLNPTQQKYIEDILARVAATFPYTVHDVTQLQFPHDPRTITDVAGRLKQQYTAAQARASHPEGPTYDRDQYTAARQSGALKPGDLYYVPGDPNPHQVPGAGTVVVPPVDPQTGRAQGEPPDPNEAQ